MRAFDAHVQRVVQAEREAKPEHLVLRKPPPPRYYHWQLLALANQLLEAGSIYVINPRDIYCADLRDADSDWLEDFHNYRLALQYERDKKRRPKELQ